jgi:kynureninase
MTLSLQYLGKLDGIDPLRKFRSAFALPEGIVYLDGNSLGALPVASAARVSDLITHEWGQGLVRSWSNHNWIEAPQRIGAKIARLVGARPHEVVVTDSVSVNLFKLVVAALRARASRRVVISEPGNFPTDLYVIEGAFDTLNAGHWLQLCARQSLLEAIDTETALVLLTHVHYKTAEVFDMHAITRRAHECGALVLWDLSHSAGALPIDLNGAEADLAVGCGYKYLNGGPGASSFLFVAERHQNALVSPLTGWLGHAKPFDFVDQYAPAPGVARFLCGTPSVLSLAALEVGVDLLLQADMTLVAAKSRRLGDILIELVASECGGFDLELVSPAEGHLRGSHVAFRHPHAYQIVRALIERGVIGDFRAPDVLRFGLTPLYLGYEDIGRAVFTLKEVLTKRLWDRPEYRVRATTT